MLKNASVYTWDHFMKPILVMAINEKPNNILLGSPSSQYWELAGRALQVRLPCQSIKGALRLYDTFIKAAITFAHGSKTVH